MPSVLPRLVTSTLNNDCYQSLKAAILSLELMPGTPLIETAIAAQFGISKTPVREAIAQLAGERLVITKPGHKSFVAGLTVEGVREIYQVRLLLESGSIRQVATRLTKEDFVQLDGFIKQSALALTLDDRDAFAAASKGFHSFLIERSENQCLIDIAQQLFDQSGRMRLAIYRTEEAIAHHVFSQSGVANHRRILSALVRRDEEQAAAMMAADLQMFLDLYESPVIQTALATLSD